MPAQDVTPEERLLKLIESGEEGQETRKFVLWDVKTWAPFVAPFTEKATRWVRTRFTKGLVPRELNLRLVNRGFGVLLAIIVATIALNTSKARPSLTDLTRRGAAPRVAAPGEPEAVSLRPLEDYLAEAGKRDIFALPLPPQPEAPPTPVAAVRPPEPVTPPKPDPADTLREKAKNLKLVGISWGATPVAMIEDTEKKETLFLTAGQAIFEMTVKAILKDRVVLSDGNAEYDLF
jgi:hypothetical protein